MNYASTVSSIPVVPRDILERFNVAEEYDSRFASNARLLQAYWREQRRLPIGAHRPQSGEPRAMGSRLAPDAARSGYNFITPEIARLVRREAAYREPGAMIEEERLWSNLLSSQPMTFNLFGQTKLDLKFGRRLIRKLFPDVAGELVEVRFEHSPGRGDLRFTGDGSAFDVAFVVKGADGAHHFIGVEVKFSETMQQPARPKRARIDELAELARIHVDPGNVDLRSDRLCQLFSEHLLAFTIAHEAKFARTGRFAIVAPQQNKDAWKAIELYKSHLCEGSPVPFSALTLEAVVAAIETCGEPEIAAKLRERYLDFSPVHALIDDWEPYADQGR